MLIALSLSVDLVVLYKSKIDKYTKYTVLLIDIAVNFLRNSEP